LGGEEWSGAKGKEKKGRRAVHKGGEERLGEKSRAKRVSYLLTYLILTQTDSYDTCMYDVRYDIASHSEHSTAQHEQHTALAYCILYITRYE